MVKLDGPCMSMGARGTLGKTLTFAKNRKTAYAKKHFIPANPKTAGQLGVRMMVTFLTQVWATLTDADKSSWSPFAEMFGLSLYHAYLKENCRRWASDLLPIKNTTNTQSFGESVVSSDFERYSNFIEISIYMDEVPFGGPWVAQFCAGLSADFIPSKNNTIALHTEWLDPPNNGDTFIHWTPPDEQTYFFKARLGLINGLTSPFVSSDQL